MQLNWNDPPPDGIPAGQKSWIDRLWQWMDGRPLRRMLVAAPFFFIGFSVLFASWIAVAFWRDSTEKNAAAVALLYVLVPVVAILMFFLVQRMSYRLMWNLERMKRRGEWQVGDPVPPPGPKGTPPAPRVEWPWSLRIRHFLLNTLTIGGVLYGFVPYAHQVQVARFISAHAIGTATARQLPALLFAYLPLFLFLGLTIALTHRQFNLMHRGLLDANKAWLLQAEFNWLGGFTLSATFSIFMCQAFGQMIITSL